MKNDPTKIRQTLEIMCRPGETYELRCLGVTRPGSDYSSDQYGYYNDLDKLAKDAASVTAEGVYLIFNPCLPELLARSANRLKRSKKGEQTTDTQILTRRWLYLDFDPVRPKGISSTDAEHQAAIDLMYLAGVWLSEHFGFPEPIYADSGNGAHLDYLVDLPLDDGGLSKRVMEAVRDKFSTDQVKVDTCNHNPSRIWKLYGTMARKGDAMPDRPHRLSQILSHPTELVPVPLPALEAVGGATKKSAVISPSSASGGDWDLDAWMRSHARVGYERNGDRYELAQCPFEPEHDRGQHPDVFQAAGGKIGFKCFGDRCGGKDWHALRELWDPADQRPRREDPPPPDDTHAPRVKKNSTTPRQNSTRTTTTDDTSKTTSSGHHGDPGRSAPTPTTPPEDCSDGAPHPADTSEPLPDEIRIELGEDDELIYRYGDVISEERTGGEYPHPPRILGRKIWPLALTQPLDGSAPGIQIRFHDRSSHPRHSVILFTNLAAKKGFAIVAAELAAIGCQISTGQGEALAKALGIWSEQRGRRVIDTVSRVGWTHADGLWIFADGAREVHGSKTIEYAGPDAGGRRGTLAQWQEAISKLCTTHGAILALGSALAGSVLGPLGRNGWILHYSGQSRSGKTLIARLAQSLWSDPSKRCETWTGTANGIELRVQGQSDMSVLLDEVKNCEPRYVADLIHRITDGKGKARSNKSGTALIPCREWSCTVLSTGENSIAEYLGDSLQGGQTVRAIDLPIERGEATLSVEHCQQLDDWLLQGIYGVGGKTWVEYLAREASWPDIQAQAREQEGRYRSQVVSSEAGSICGSLSLILTALLVAVDCELISLDKDLCRAAVAWALSRIVDTRVERDSPEERCWQMILASIGSEPANWPTEENYDSAQRCWGIRRPAGIWTQEGWLAKSGICTKAGVSPRRWLDWLALHGLIRREKDRRIMGILGRWVSIHIPEDPVELSLPI